MDRRRANRPNHLPSIGMEVVRVWFYLFGRNDRYPDPAGEIDTLAKLDERGSLSSSSSRPEMMPP